MILLILYWNYYYYYRENEERMEKDRIEREAAEEAAKRAEDEKWVISLQLSIGFQKFNIILAEWIIERFAYNYVMYPIRFHEAKIESGLK